MTRPRAIGLDRPPGRVAVVDLGSNSVRLVVFDGLSRTPVPMFNERVLCGLGRGLRTSARTSMSWLISLFEKTTPLDRSTCTAPGIGVHADPSRAPAAWTLPAEAGLDPSPSG